MYNNDCCCRFFSGFLLKANSRKQIVRSRPIHIEVTASKKHAHTVTRSVFLSVCVCAILLFASLSPNSLIRNFLFSRALSVYFPFYFRFFIPCDFFYCRCLSHFIIYFGSHRCYSQVRVVSAILVAICFFSVLFTIVLYIRFYHILLNHWITTTMISVAAALAANK